MSPEPWIDREAGPLAWRQTMFRGRTPESSHHVPVVFLHGLGGSREAWNPQLRAMADVGWPALAWDMPGYGAAARLESLSFPAVAGRLVELLDHEGIEVVDLVGLSLGGMHALHTVLAHPTRVRRLVLADTSPAFGLDGTRREEWVASRLDPLDRGSTLAELAPDVLDAIAHRTLSGSTRAELIAAFARIGEPGFRAAVHCLPDHDVRERLSEIEHRTLVMVGERDAETPMSYARLLADGLVDAELVVLADVGHLSPSEDPDLFNQHLIRFLGATDANA